MAQINEPILEQTFEIIRDRIFDILVEEFPNQQALQPGIDLSPEIVKERSVSFDSSQGSLINILFINDSYFQKTPVNKVGDFVYYIDVYTNKKDTDDDSGDELSRIACQRIAGVVRGILESSTYKYLGFNTIRPVQRLGFQNIIQAEPDARKDASNQSQIRLQFDVRSTDINYLEGVRDLELLKIQFKLGETDKGNLLEKAV